MTVFSAKLMGIAIKNTKRGDMHSLDSALVSLKQGIANDFRGRPGKRQVTVLSYKAWSEACLSLNQELNWKTRRANLLVDDLNLIDSTDKIIVIGEVRLLITGETDPCSRMNEAYVGLFDALAKDWRGGVCCQVLNEGEVFVNDKVSLIG